MCGCLAQPENLIQTEAKGGMATSGHEQGSRVWVGADGCSNLPHFLVSGALTNLLLNEAFSGDFNAVLSKQTTCVSFPANVWDTIARQKPLNGGGFILAS